MDQTSSRESGRQDFSWWRSRVIPAAKYLWRVTIVFSAYFLAARAGLAVPFTDANVSPVWPPSGVALAAILLCGPRVWPGVALAAFLANYLTPIPHVAALGMAIGNTSSALLGAFLLRQIPGFQTSLGRLRDVIGLVTRAAILSSAVAASCGVLTLFLSRVEAWSAVSSAWLIWWLGDAMGVLIVAPLVLTLANLRAFRNRHRTVELLLLNVGVLFTCLLLFDAHLLIHVGDDVLAFAVFPFIIWAAIRFGIGGVSLVSCTIAAISVWQTALGTGPFVRHDPLHNAILLQLFLAVISITGMILAAVIAEREQVENALAMEQELMTERKRAERRLTAQYQVTRVLSESATLPEAAPRILAAVCTALDWDLGALWSVDQPSDELHCLVTWHSPRTNFVEFAAVSRATRFRRSIGLPGRVWYKGQPAWIADVTTDANFPRAAAAEREGLHGALGVPVMLGREVLAVLEFFSSQIREPDQDLLEMMTAIGSQIGQFIERKRTEEAWRAAEKLATAGRMAATVAHEINNPLEAVTNLLYLLSSDAKLSPTARAYAAAAETELARVAHVAKQTLAFYREPSKPGPVNPAQLLDSLVDLYRVRIQSKNIRIEKRYDFEGDIYGSAGELRQVFSNLFVNALDASHSSGAVTLHVFRARKWREAASEEGVRVVIADNGPGIAPELRKKIFEPFFTTKQATGTGLGLWIAHGIVHKHGGAIQVRSSTQAGRQGTFFSVFLPHRAAQPQQTGAASGSGVAA